MVKAWQDDIDNVLVFAGLFSAIITAFVIESYYWLDEDFADTTVALLTKLILVQANGSQFVSLEPIPFKADASSVRINVFWFFSLIFSLTSVLFGPLCKQWIRERQCDITIRTPGEVLALRRLRRDSCEKWDVSSFLSTLPILLVLFSSSSACRIYCGTDIWFHLAFALLQSRSVQDCISSRHCYPT
uniref:DUF6535 domain-containing protein n=1 Tax=Moniliophthora roreri TaxID=221103 RepID=A0A0W0G813_MONRR